MRFVLAMVLGGLVGFPQAVNAQGDQPTEQEPALDLEWLEWSDVQWLQWLLDVEQLGEPERSTWSRPRPPSEGSWLRLEVDFAGLRVVPRPPPRPPREVPELSKRQRKGVAIGVSVGVVVLIVVIGTAVAVSNWEEL
jgi:hypothetical protein